MHNHENNDNQVKDFKKAIATLLKNCKPYKTSIIIVMILSALASALGVYGPGRLKEITDTITEGIMTGIDLSKVTKIAITLTIVYTLSWLFNCLAGFIMATVTNKFSQKLRKNLSHKINKLPLKYFDKNSYGDVLSRITNDVDTIGQSLNNSISDFVGAITLFIGSIIMMFATNWIMAITGIVASLIGFALMIVILSKSQKYFLLQQQQLGELNGHIEEVYSGHDVVTVYNANKETTQKFDEINNKLYDSARKSRFLSGLMMPLMSFIGSFGYVAVCVVGAALVINGNITFGVIVAFMIYIRLFTNPLSTIAQAMTYIQSTAAASERVFDFLDEEEMPSEKNITQKLLPGEVKGNIIFDHVKFGYDEDKIIIKDFSANIKAGSKVAIVGPTGAGKTTMVNLLMKFYNINSGDIKIDNISIKDLTRENIHDLFVMVLQDTWLFKGTIKDNIRFNRDNITDEEIKTACKTVGMDHYIRSLSKGYDTMLEEVDNLSAGQKQLLTIASCMTSSAPLLILDEATSSVDTRTEELVQKAMDKLTEGKTSFIIAHRLSTIKNADLILVMNEGNIIEQGNHEELLKQNGFYAKLYNSQFENV